MPRLIVLTYALDPGPGGPEGYVTKQLLEALASEGWPGGVSVITAGGVPADRNGQSLAETPGWRFHAIAAPAWTAAKSPRARAANRLAHIVHGENARTVLWARAAARALESELDSDPEAFVYSRMLPFVSLRVAAMVRRKRCFRWMASFNDPVPSDIWPAVYTPNAWSCRIARRRLRRWLPWIGACTFPSAGMREVQIRAFPEIARRPYRILPHIAFPREPVPAPHSAKLEIALAGNIRKECVDAAFLGALRRFEQEYPGEARFSWHLWKRLGKSEEGYRRSATEIRVTHELRGSALDRELWAASVLLDLEEPKYAPLLVTKLANYISFRKPIWAICARQGTAWNLARRAGGYVSEAGNEDSILETLRAIHRDWRDGSLARPLPEEVAQRFHPASQVRALRELCAVLDGGPAPEPETWP